MTPTGSTVIVVSYNSRSNLAACLASVMEQDTPTDVVVVDNASADDSAALVAAEFPTARLVANLDNRGFATAVNQGLALAAGEYVLLLNPDAVLLPGTLARLTGFLDMHPGAAAVGPRQYLDAGRTWQWSIVPWPPHWRTLVASLPGLGQRGLARRQLAGRWALNRAIWRGEEPQRVPYLSGACLLLRRAALEAVGGLDEGYFLFFEDTDLCNRLRAAGWTLHAVPAAGVIHAGMGSVRASPDGGGYHLLASGSRYLARHGDPLTRAWWVLLRLRRGRRAGQSAQFGVQYQVPRTRPARTLHWLPVSDTAAYWVEVASDPTFLYAAAAQVVEPACTLPTALSALTSGTRLFWRVAPGSQQETLGHAGPIRQTEV